MLRPDRATCATLALLAFASVATLASVAARAEEPHHEYHAPERARQSAHRETEARQSAHRETEARQSHRAYAARAEAAHTTSGRIAYEHFQPGPHSYSGMAGHNAAGVPAVSRPTGMQVHAVRYSNTVSRTVERTIRPGLVSRTFVSGGHVLYTRVYQSHVWHQFGRAFAYETFVPGVRYPAVYYNWALGAWPRPITYAWGWQAQPWYPMYGVLFTPYPVYSSPDLWMTDYIIAQSMQTAYQAQPVAPAVLQTQEPPTPAIDSGGAMPYPPPSDVPPAPQPSDAAPGPASSEVPPVPQTVDMPTAPVALPPAITPAVKAQLDTQIKVQLQDRQAATATPATLTTESSPPALRPNHVFFQVVQPLNVPGSSANHFCSLGPNDYIKRTGGMSPDDWMIPVVVELSAPSDCPAGLHTRIGLNDLNAMENEQEARVMDALQAASKSMGPNGPPNTPGIHPTLIADGRAAPDLPGLSSLPQAP
jgi:hypothetical protein